MDDDDEEDDNDAHTFANKSECEGWNYDVKSAALIAANSSVDFEMVVGFICFEYHVIITKCLITTLASFYGFPQDTRRNTQRDTDRNNREREHKVQRE